MGKTHSAREMQTSSSRAPLPCKLAEAWRLALHTSLQSSMKTRREDVQVTACVSSTQAACGLVGPCMLLALDLCVDGSLLTCGPHRQAVLQMLAARLEERARPRLSSADVAEPAQMRKARSQNVA